MFVSVGCLDFLPPLTIVHCVASHSENMVAMLLGQASPLPLPSTVGQERKLLCCIVFVFEPCGGGQAAWFPHGRVFGAVRKRLFFVLYQSKAGRSRVFETPLEIIFSGCECDLF